QRYWQRRRFKLITGFMRGFERVLDVGCGSSRILGSKPDMVGLDVQAHKLRFDRRYGNPLVHASIFALPFRDASFDCVGGSEMICCLRKGAEPALAAPAVETALRKAA